MDGKSILGILLHGNLLTLGSGDGFLPWVIGPLVGAAALGHDGLDHDQCGRQGSIGTGFFHHQWSEKSMSLDFNNPTNRK